MNGDDAVELLFHDPSFDEYWNIDAHNNNAKIHKRLKVQSAAWNI